MMTGQDALNLTRELARVAGLELSAERLAQLAPRLVRFREFLKPVREIPLADTEPAFITSTEC